MRLWASLKMHKSMATRRSARFPATSREIASKKRLGVDHVLVLDPTVQSEGLIHEGHERRHLIKPTLLSHIDEHCVPNHDLEQLYLCYGR